jgi:uncharacterized membrane protein YhhN
MSGLQIAICILYVCAAVGDVAAAKLKKKNLSYITTPLIMPLLALLYILVTDEFRLIVLFALVLGFLGEVLSLRSENESFFMGSITAFLAGHVLYIIAFLVPWSSLAAVRPWFFLLVIPYFVFYISVYRILAPHLGEMKIPGAVYMAAVCLMSFAALFRAWHQSGFIIWLAFIGSLLFIAADTILASNQFKGKIKNGDMFATLTYIPAQALIMIGFALG